MARNNEMRIEMTDIRSHKHGYQIEIRLWGNGSFLFQDADLAILAKDCISGLNELMRKQIARNTNLKQQKSIQNAN